MAQDARTVRVAAVQAAPVFLDRDGTLAKTDRLLTEAAAGGAKLVVFTEAWIPGYPDWIWRTRPWSGVATALYHQWFDQSVVVPGPHVDALSVFVERAGVYAVIGVAEREQHGGTVYNTLLYFGPDGALLGKHRKLMPTGAERLVWGAGDGSTLSTFDTPWGPVGGLICWENYMPLARTALYAAGITVLVSPTWDNSDVWVPSMRHIAREGRVFVVSTNSFLHGGHIPGDVAAGLYGGEEDWLARGNACVVGPDGTVLAGPLIEEEGVLFADLDLDKVTTARHEFDPVGHYARGDVLRLTVDTRESSSVTTLHPPTQ